MVPPAVVDELGWEAGQELKGAVTARDFRLRSPTYVAKGTRRDFIRDLDGRVAEVRQKVRVEYGAHTLHSEAEIQASVYHHIRNAYDGNDRIRMRFKLDLDDGSGCMPDMGIEWTSRRLLLPHVGQREPAAGPCLRTASAGAARELVESGSNPGRLRSIDIVAAAPTPGRGARGRGARPDLGRLRREQTWEHDRVDGWFGLQPGPSASWSP